MTEKIHPYDSDHTALVHVLWRAQYDGDTMLPGIIPQDTDCDKLASHIMQSKWLRAVKQHANALDEAKILVDEVFQELWRRDHA